MNENNFLNLIIPMLKQGSDIIVGPGDDCAVIDIGNKDYYYLIAVDQIISGVHFDPAITKPQEAGAKLLKRNISDIAAMGGKPAHAVVTVAASHFDESWLTDFYKGLSSESKKWNVSICGGDIASLLKLSAINNQQEAINRQLVTTLTITGYVNKEKLCLRKNAEIGDVLFVTGLFGNSYDSRHHLTFEPRIKESEFLSGIYTNTIMDVSDGLLIDLQRIAKAADRTINIDLNKIPLRRGANVEKALTDGEDYELIFTVKKNKIAKLVKNWICNTELTMIGEVLGKKDNLDVCCISSNFNGQTCCENLIQKYSKIGWDHINN